MFLVFLLGAMVASWYFVRIVGKREANLLLAAFLGVIALSLLYNLLVNIGIFNNNPQFYFIPISYTLSFGPLLFFFTKSRLFRPFYLQKKDFKHFILPLAQAVFYLTVGFRDMAFKQQLWEANYLPFYKPVEGLLYLISFSLYLYFSYRFIRYKLALLRKKGAFPWELDKVNRLKRMVKGLILLFVISGAYMVGDFVTYQFLGLNLYDIRGFTYIGDLSFTFIVLWVGYYGFRNSFFPSRKRLGISKSKDQLRQKINALFKEEKIFLDDELDKRKLGYYLKIRTSYLDKILTENFKQLISQCRIAEAKERINNPRYKDYTLESIGLEVGFSRKKTFLKTFETIEKMSPMAFKKQS